MGAVARLFRLADADNQRRIKAAFPEYFEKYKDASRRLQVAETVAAPLKGEAHDAPTLGDIVGVVSALAAKDAELQQMAQAHSASFGALATLSAALLDGEVDDYTVCAQRIIDLVQAKDAELARLTAERRWRPIETALTGQRVLVWDGLVQRIGACIHGKWLADNGKDMALGFPPTRWHLLPDPPWWPTPPRRRHSV